MRGHNPNSLQLHTPGLQATLPAPPPDQLGPQACARAPGYFRTFKAVFTASRIKFKSPSGAFKGLRSLTTPVLHPTPLPQTHSTLLTLSSLWTFAFVVLAAWNTFLHQGEASAKAIPDLIFLLLKHFIPVLYDYTILQFSVSHSARHLVYEP